MWALKFLKIDDILTHCVTYWSQLFVSVLSVCLCRQRYSGLILCHLALVHVEKEGKSHSVFTRRQNMGEVTVVTAMQEEKNSET